MRKSSSQEAALTPETPAIDEFRTRLRKAAASASPLVAALAAWLAERPEEIAFNSVRGLADLSGANANTVVRLTHAIGYPGYEACRAAVQDALRRSQDIYGPRAGELSRQDSGSVLDAIREAGHRNVDSVFTPEAQSDIEAAARLMLAARHVHVIGVRSCYAVADYMGYVARMAFDNFAPRTAIPGDIRDSIAAAGPEDVVMCITFPHYSVETVAGHDLALRRGARIVAVTDSLRSPIAKGAEVVLIPGMQGPQPLPSMVAVFALVEAIVACMIVRSDAAQRNIARFEQRLLDSGAYHRG